VSSQRARELWPGYGDKGVQQCVGADPEYPPASGQPVEQESVAFLGSARLDTIERRLGMTGPPADRDDHPS
jgi:hypothetical protein